mmetsp:Transcript_123681/g.309100  ORF Transcript_123681/g.309100 Transcript_123681/m.309100 type:complete len:231 (-) Transcript_123681:1144-1836(-)
MQGSTRDQVSWSDLTKQKTLNFAMLPSQIRSPAVTRARARRCQARDLAREGLSSCAGVALVQPRLQLRGSIFVLLARFLFRLPLPHMTPSSPERAASGRHQSLRKQRLPVSLALIAIAARFQVAVLGVLGAANAGTGPLPGHLLAPCVEFTPRLVEGAVVLRAVVQTACDHVLGVVLQLLLKLNAVPTADVEHRNDLRAQQVGRFLDPICTPDWEIENVPLPQLVRECSL